MIKLFWWKYERNFGDELSPLICALLSGNKVEFAAPETCDLVAIGSLLESVHRHSSKKKGQSNPIKNTKSRFAKNILSKAVEYSLSRPYRCEYTGKIWGTGLITDKKGVTRYPNAQFHAVRGKLTQRILDLPTNIATGDPGLLVRYLAPPANKRYKFGIIPHYVDLELPSVKALQSLPYVKIIDPTEGVDHVINSVAQCEMVASSGLHGLIVADSLEVPNVWIKLSKSIIGQEFKFNDYYSNFGFYGIKPLQVGKQIELGEIEMRAGPYERPGIDSIIDNLINSFPYLIKNWQRNFHKQTESAAAVVPD